MDVPTDTILERMTLRSVDPVTGERWVLCLNLTSSTTVNLCFAIHVVIRLSSNQRLKRYKA